MFYGTYVLASRGKVDGPKGEKWTVPIVDGPSKKDGPSKVDGLLTESGRSWGNVDGLLTKSGRSVRK